MGKDAILIILIIWVIVFLLGYFILRKIRPNKNHFKNPILWIISIITSPVIYIGLIFLWITLSTQYPHKDFNKEKWNSDIESRFEYADDLVDNNLLIGLTKTEVETMLGEPDSENANTLTYYIGFSPRHFIGIDPDWLEIKFENGKVINVRIYES